MHTHLDAADLALKCANAAHRARHALHRRAVNRRGIHRGGRANQSGEPSRCSRESVNRHRQLAVQRRRVKLEESCEE